MERRPGFRVTRRVDGVIVAVRKMQDRGRIQIPKEVRQELGLSDGDTVYWVRSRDGKFYIVKAGQLEGYTV